MEKNTPGTRRQKGSRTVLFASLTVMLLMTLLAVAALVFGGRQIMENRRAARILKERYAITTLGDVIRNHYPDRRSAVLECYGSPAQVDLDRVPWAPVCQPHPMVGYLPVPGRQKGGVINAQQMRDSRDLVLPKPSNTFRIFVTGGSFAWGSGAPDESSTVPQYLERILNEGLLADRPRVQVYNTAVCGWASTQERILIENRLSQWQPDLVIALSGANDMHWGFLWHNVLDQRTYEDEMFFALIDSAVRRAGFGTFPAQPPSLEPERVAPAKVAERFAWNMRLAAAALADKGVPMVVALQPGLAEKYKTFTASERQWMDRYEDAGKSEYMIQCFDAIAGRFSSDGAASSLRLIDLRDTFADRQDTIFFDMFHVGDKGNELTAHRLAEGLRRLGLAR